MGNEEIRKITAQKFFSDLHRVVTQAQGTQTDANDLSEQVDLKVSITNIEKDSHYQIQISSIISGSSHSLCSMESCAIDPLTNSAVLKTAIIMKYFFEREQKLIFTINKSGNYSKSMKLETTLGCIMGSRKTTLIKEIPEGDGEILNVCAEKMKNSEEILILNLKINPNSSKVNFNETKNKLVFHLSSNNRPVYYSECLNNEGRFNKVKIPAGLLSNGINLTFINCKKKNVLQTTTTVQELGNKKQFPINMSKNRHFTCISESILTREYTFVDYLKAGVRLGLSIAIDFTGSNGIPTDPKSLHYIRGQEPNQYERAIFSCGNIMAYYDYDQLFPCYGFGAKINNVPTPLFNLNFNQDPNIHTIPSVIDAYHNALNSVKLWGPTHFGPIIKSTNDMIKAENNPLSYQVLMILTDGMIDDVDNTINQLVEGSFLPLSVIIIGVGTADFTTMDVLDADDNPLVDSNGRKSARDLVQFVPFLKYESDPAKLAQEVLEEIPRQIVEYYQQNNIDPMKLMT
jgi:hypothetical protein